VTQHAAHTAAWGAANEEIETSWAVKLTEHEELCASAKARELGPHQQTLIAGTPEAAQMMHALAEAQATISQLKKMVESQQAEMSQANVRYKVMEEAMSQHTQLTDAGPDATTVPQQAVDGVPAFAAAVEPEPSLCEKELEARMALREFHKESQLDQEDVGDKGKGKGKEKDKGKDKNKDALPRPPPRLSIDYLGFAQQPNMER